MPELTQQQWLEHKLSFMGITVGTEAMQAAALIASWPSSPQGLAVKQMMEAAEKLVVSDVGLIRIGDVAKLIAAWDAARKAGLGT